MKRGLNKFKQKGEKSIAAELEQLHRRDAFRSVITEKISEKSEEQVARPANVPKRKDKRVDKGTWSSGREKSRGENLTEGRHIFDSINGISHAHGKN